MIYPWPDIIFIPMLMNEASISCKTAWRRRLSCSQVPRKLGFKLGAFPVVALGVYGWVRGFIVKGPVHDEISRNDVV